MRVTLLRVRDQCRIIKAQQAASLTLLQAFVVCGFFLFDSLNLLIYVFLDLLGLGKAEHVGWTWHYLCESGDNIGFDHGLVDLDLFPLGLTEFGSLLLVFCISDQTWGLQDDLLELSVLGWAVGHDTGDL